MDTTAPPGEVDLIERARRGDPDAWEALVRLHQQPVFRFAYLQLGDPDEAEDAAQEVFLRAHRYLDTFDAARPLRPWLLGITVHTASNRRRSLGRYWAALQRLGRAELPAAPSLDEQHDSRWQAEALWSAIRQLRLEDQQVIYLRHFLEMPVEESAAALNVSPGTVKSRLHRALERLRARIERDYPELRLNAPAQPGDERKPA